MNQIVQVVGAMLNVNEVH